MSLDASYFLKSQILSRLTSGNPLLDIFLILYQEKLFDYLLKTRYFFLFLWQWIVATATAWNLYRPRGKLRKTIYIRYITESREINALYQPIFWYVNRFSQPLANDTVSFEYVGREHVIQAITPIIPSQQQFTFIYQHSTLGPFLCHCRLYTELIKIYVDRPYDKEDPRIEIIVELENEGQQQVLADLIRHAKGEYDNYLQSCHLKAETYHLVKGEWSGTPNHYVRQMPTVILRNNLIVCIQKDIDAFVNRERWYQEHGIRYARRYLFHGPPGTGKSSVIQALSTHLGRNIYYLNLASVSDDEQLKKVLDAVPARNSLVVLEDIDRMIPLLHKDYQPQSHSPVHSSLASDLLASSDPRTGSPAAIAAALAAVGAPVVPRITMSAILNALDGSLCQCHGQILIMTANQPEKLEPALLRPGRIDRRFHFDYCDQLQIEKLYEHYFQRSPPAWQLPPSAQISPSAVTSHFLTYMEEPEAAWTSLQKELLET